MNLRLDTKILKLWPKLVDHYTCEQCGVELSQYKRLLHTHHINGVKTDNSISNLRALCLDCHKKQPKHEHMHVTHNDQLIINQLRRDHWCPFFL
ncbi:HNH endonuclease [Pseudoalteromonas piscicida]|uniref:HNH endonuclease n=1 Tax=Pseudoalteromonas piscicida TaxID=43662 RepID=UPI000BB51DDF|nr:HNH endonuclease [Pseudoalteromonas piscicida]WPU32705.1 HNH endonuclease [Pseudoalteromonas piscicida]